MVRMTAAAIWYSDSHCQQKSEWETWDAFAVKQQFQNFDIQCWEHTDQRLGCNRPFICLQAGPPACDILLAALDELAAEGVPARRKLTLMPSRRQNACSSIRLVLSPPSDEFKQMSLTRDQTTAVFEFTPAGLSIFRNAVVAWRNGSEDFSVHPNPATRKKEDIGKKDLASGEVWFWTPFIDP